MHPLVGGVAACGHTDDPHDPVARYFPQPTCGRHTRGPHLVPAHPGVARDRSGLVHVSDQHGPNEKSAWLS